MNLKFIHGVESVHRNLRFMAVHCVNEKNRNVGCMLLSPVLFLTP